MNKRSFYKTCLIISMTLFLASCAKNPLPCDCKNGGVPTVKVFATGLNNPRGIEFGPDGNLYVAEAGIGGTDSTVGICDQVVFPIGPYVGSPTGGRISKINRWGVRSTITDQLPSSKANDIIGGDIEGVSDVAFIGHTLYGLLAGAGCSHGVPSVSNGVIKLDDNGSWKLIADLSAFQKANPAQNVQPGDFEPDGTPYSMVNVHGDLYVIEPNHGDFFKVTPQGAITRIADISASQGHIVPTSVAYREGNFFVGNLHPFPVDPGSSSIYKITPGGQVSVALTGFTTVLGVTFDEWGRMYVLENTTVAGPGPAPGTGDIVRVDQTGKKEVLVTGLSVPTALTFGPDGKLYVSNVGFGPTAIGGGQILQIDLEHCTAAPAANGKIQN